MRVKDQQLIVTKLLELLVTSTDRNHLLSSKEITSRLGKEYGYFIERKTLYHYMNELNKFYDIKVRLIKNTNYYYYNGKERLTTAELAILLDAVDSLNFLNQKDSETIKNKLRAASRIAEKSLPEVKSIALNLAKDANSDMMNSLNLINRALKENKMITFHYFDYDIEGKRIYREYDRVYKVTPIDTIVRDNKYYLVGITVKHSDNYSIYRIDRMDMLKISLTDAIENELITNFNPIEFSNQVFLMHNGPLRTYVLKCPNTSYMPNIIFDNLGYNFDLIEENKDYFTIEVDLRESSKLNSWLDNYNIEIISKK